MIGLRAVATMCDVCGLIVAKLADEYWPVSFPQTDTAVDEMDGDARRQRLAEKKMS